jgi:hypothetical protein
LRLLVGIASVAALAACGSAPQDKSDWERKNETRLDAPSQDAVPPPPVFPQKANLAEFFVTSASDFKFFVDRSTISVDRGVVRYVLVARSPAGAENVSYEALRCRTGEYRVYAFGRADGTWAGRPTEWRKIPAGQTLGRWHTELSRNYFCPNGTTLADGADGARALELGAHPWLKSVESQLGGASD